MFLEDRLKHIRSETPGLKNATHLLASGSALMPQPVVNAVIEHTLLEAEHGGYDAYAMRSESLDRVYHLAASHIGASSNEIAILENASAAWSHAFYALPLKRGSRVLTSESEYAANYVALLHRAKLDDLKIEVVSSDETGAIDIPALERMIDSEVALVAITWAPTNSGLINPAERVGEITKKYGVPFLLDACQAVGQMRVDVEALNCDFLSATGRKFLRGPRGIGFLYIKSKWLEHLEPAMLDHFGAPLISKQEYELRSDARRFETWENSYALRAGLAKAIEYADDIGIDAIESRVSMLAEYCRAKLGECEQIELRDIGAKLSGIVSFTINDADAQDVVSKMADAGFVIGLSHPSNTVLDSETRSLPTVLRIAPHYYNTQIEISDCVVELRKLIQSL